MATAWALRSAGLGEVTVVERGRELGGLAGSFERDGHVYPLGYHHILGRDRVLLEFLDRIGASSRVRWRRVRMLFRVREGLFDLGHPIDFLRFPMSFADKLSFVGLMLRAFGKSDWSDWQDRGADRLLDAWASPGVRQALFEPLTRLKFELPCEEVSAAWLGARLHFREGSSALGYIPEANWTKVLCEGVETLMRDVGVEVRLDAPLAAVQAEGGRIVSVELATGEKLSADLFVSTIPTAVLSGLLTDDTPNLESIRYSALISVIAATRQKIRPDFYWMNLPTLDLTACGLFNLTSLNPTIGAPGETVLNFVTHLNGRHRPLFSASDQELVSRYRDDFRQIFGFDLEARWFNVARVPMYSPVLTRGYHNPPVRSTRHSNLYFAGNYRTFPSIVSTGTALGSGLETAKVVIETSRISIR